MSAGDEGPAVAPSRWVAVLHKTHGWIHAPDGAFFRLSGETVELVGGVHRCGTAWYTSSITKVTALDGDGVETAQPVELPRSSW